MRLSECLTKHSAKPDILIKAINGGTLPNVDKQPPFRELMKDRQRAYHTSLAWFVRSIDDAADALTFLGFDVADMVRHSHR
eukprot:6559734-Prorocentrum_lima.AAC.1